MCFALWLWPGWHCNNTTDRSWVWFLLLSILSLGESVNQIVHDNSAVSHLEPSPNHKHEGFEPTVACHDSVRILDDQRSFQSIISPMTKSLNCSLARKIRRQDHSDRHERKKISEIFWGGHLNGFVATDDWIEQAIIQRMSMFSNWRLLGPGLEAGLARTIENINHSLQRRSKPLRPNNSRHVVQMGKFFQCWVFQPSGWLVVKGFHWIQWAVAGSYHHSELSLSKNPHSRVKILEELETESNFTPTKLFF